MADLTQQINELASKGPADLAETDRLALLQASQKLVEALENPVEKILRLFFSIYDPIALRLCVDLNLVDIALAHDGPISLSDLASASKADPYFLQRLMRMLIPLNIFTSPTPATYATTPFAPLLATGSGLKGAVIHLSHLHHSTAAMPEYFAANGYRNPTSAYDAPFNLAHSCKGSTYFDYVALPENARLNEAFNQTMELQKSGQDGEFMQWYPATERLVVDDDERVLFVDVGGSMGHQVRKFGEKYPNLKGKLVLEDLPQVVDKADSVPAHITKLGHDFFKPQPEAVKGAKAFYLRTILHDWPEQEAAKILTNIVDAMASDSVVLVHESILPDEGVTHIDAKLDWHMLNMGALERTEKQWAELADGVGLKINGIWWEEQGLGRMGMIEMGKKEG